MLPLIETIMVRAFEVLFFTGITGCIVMIVMSWYSIFKDELTSNSER
jgi:hypothetical protein